MLADHHERTPYCLTAIENRGVVLVNCWLLYCAINHRQEKRNEKKLEVTEKRWKWQRVHAKKSGKTKMWLTYSILFVGSLRKREETKSPTHPTESLGIPLLP